MSINIEKYKEVLEELKNKATLVAVSKTKPIEDVEALYNLGHRNFGENYVQELCEKEAALPKDIDWHYIGHLQSNKVKYIAPFVHLIHGVDSINLLKEINKQALKNNKVINCLLQVHIAQEETKFGFNADELKGVFEIIKNNELQFKNINVIGLMGMASFSNNINLIREEFKSLKVLFNLYTHQSSNHLKLTTLSMGMSGDYTIAIEEGSNMVRIGSLLFGERNYVSK